MFKAQFESLELQSFFKKLKIFSFGMLQTLNFLRNREIVVI